MYFGSFICEVGKERGQVTAIAGTKICDGVIDCVDGGDEVGCSKLVDVLFYIIGYVFIFSENAIIYVQQIARLTRIISYF